jgi:spermidine synthase
LPVLLFVTGFLGIAFEIAGVRVLSQILENTIYSYAAVLAIYLLGTAAGGTLQQGWGDRRAPTSELSQWAGATALACLAGVWILRRADRIYSACRGAFGDSPVAVAGAEMIVAAAVFLGPTVFMGATFSLLVQRAAHGRVGVGRALAVNTLGSALAPWVAGVLMVPSLGTKWTLVALTLGYVVLQGMACRHSQGPGSLRPWSLPAVALAALALLPRHLQIVDVPPDGRVTDFREGVMASVAVVTDATAHRSLRVNNRFQMGGTAVAAAEYRHAHIPLLLHPAPKRALFLGLGTGITLGAASLHEGLQSDGVELVPEVVEMMPHFEPENFSPTRHPRVRVLVADARRFVRAGGSRYDVIVADLFHPARDGAGTLYTREHFEAIRARLSADGLFCQWLPLHQLDDEMGRVITRTFLEVFPHATAWLLRFNIHAPVVGLVGTLQPLTCSTNTIEQRAGAGGLAEHLKRLPLADSVRFLGNLVADAPALRSFAAGAPLNTDDDPRVTFGAPRLTYQKQAHPEARLRTWLQLGVTDWISALGLPAEAAPFAQRLSAYARARDVYLRGLVQDEAGDAVGAMDSYVESARLSEDFTAGYAQCLSLASLQSKSNPAATRRLLERLIAAQPGRPVAREMLERLGP